MVEDSTRQLTYRKHKHYNKEKPKGEPVKCLSCSHTVAFRQDDILYVRCRACGKQVKFKIISV